jgi:hypothetical protein
MNLDARKLTSIIVRAVISRRRRNPNGYGDTEWSHHQLGGRAPNDIIESLARLCSVGARNLFCSAAVRFKLGMPRAIAMLNGGSTPGIARYVNNAFWNPCHTIGRPDRW